MRIFLTFVFTLLLSSYVYADAPERWKISGYGSSAWGNSCDDACGQWDSSPCQAVVSEVGSCQNPSVGVRRYGSCGEDQTVNSATGACEDCPEGEFYVTELAACSEPLVCPEGQENIDEVCVNECVAPEQRDSVTQECGIDSLDCPAGEVQNTFLSGGVWHTECMVREPGTSPEDCLDVDGYITDAQGNEYQACADNRNACEATGGTHGQIDGSDVCIPADYIDDLPDCDINTLQLDGVGGYVCAANGADPADDPNNPDVPNYGGDGEKDTDGDGIPDYNDPDIDGDGIPNSTDTDIDGDGVPNEDDRTPDGEETESSVSGGGSCASRPQCTGDAVQCAILYQTWSQRCENSNLAEDAPDFSTVQANSDSLANSSIDLLGTAISDAIGDGDAGMSEPTSIKDDMLGGFLDVDACSDMSFIWHGETFAITCADTQDLRTILAWVCSLYTLFALFNLSTRSVATGR